MTDFEGLLAAKRAADAAVAEAEAELLDQLVGAKARYRDEPTDANRDEKERIVAQVQELRAAQRAGRAGVAVGGAAVVSEQNGG